MRLIDVTIVLIACSGNGAAAGPAPTLRCGPESPK
jgi:hypothetical protein